MFKASRKDREATEKRKLLRLLIDAEGEKCTNAIIFCNRKMDVDTVAKSLKKYGYDAAPIHGDLDQSQRTKTLEGFRAGELRFLVASDVAARGLDVPSVSHVFNFDVPSHAEDYVHRIGRTGRAGRDGKAIMICQPRDDKNFEDVERLVQKEIPRIENPLGNAKPAEEASDAPAKTDDKPKRTRSRSRKSDKPQADKPQAEQPQADERQTDRRPTDKSQTDKPQTDKPVEASNEAKQPQAEAPKEAKADVTPEREAESAQGGRKSQRGGNNDKPSRGRGRNDKRGGNDNRVVGLGDHTPDFIGLSFRERI
jgi:superfamily II DNA/RNA helicase